MRIDCSMAPWLADSVTSRDLFSNGVWGCEAARHLSAIDVAGVAAPCSFTTRSSIGARELADPSQRTSDVVLAAHRRVPIDEPCASCAVREVCRGGCRAVAAFYGDPHAPDPECPRVIRARSGSSERRQSDDTHD